MEANTKKNIIVIVVIVVIVIIGFAIWWNFYRKLSANEERPDGTIISTGRFREMSGSYRLDCQGKVDLIKTNDGDYVLYFYEAEIDCMQGKIYLSDETSFNSQTDDLGTNVEIGPLTYNIGSFSVSIPDDVDVSKYNTVVIIHGISNAIQGYASIN